MSFRRISVPVFANYFLLFASFAILSPYLQLYLHARGLTPSRIGLLLGALELAGIAGPLILGRLADATRAYRALIAAAFLVTTAVFALMEWTRSFPVYVACIIVMGFAYRSAIPLLDALVTRILPDPGRQYGKLRIAGSFGFVAISLCLQAGGWLAGGSSRAILSAFALAAVPAAGIVALLFMRRVFDTTGT